jgi:hypothetical protein
MEDCWRADGLEEAQRHIDDALIFEKDNASAIAASFMANADVAKFEETIAAGQRGVAVAYRAPSFLGVMGVGSATAGPYAEALTILEDLRVRPRRVANGRLRGPVARCAREVRRRLRGSRQKRSTKASGATPDCPGSIRSAPSRYSQR